MSEILAAGGPGIILGSTGMYACAHNDYKIKSLTSVVQLLKKVAENTPRAVGQAALEGQDPGYAKNTDMSSIGR